MTNIAQDTLQMMTKIGLFYGSTTCYTEMAGEKIRDTINLSLGFSAVTLHDIALDPITRMAEYQYLILGIPTWDFGELQEDWESHWDAMDNLDLTGKKSLSMDLVTKWVIQNGFKTHWVISGLKSELKGQVPLALGLTKGLNLKTQKHFPQTRKCL